MNVRRLVVVCVVWLIGVVAPGVAHASDYYLSALGNDANAGTSAAPWQTIAKINTVNFGPGDRLLFAGGQVFRGTLILDSGDAATPSQPIVISSYGSGRATINGDGGNALFLYNIGGVAIDNINFAGDAGNTAHGLNIYADLPGGTKLDGLVFNNVDVSGFGGYGIVVGGWNGLTGYTNLRITNVWSHGNSLGGIQVYGYPNSVGRANSNVYIANTMVFDNLGVSGSGSPDGSGIVLGQVDGATVEHSVAHDNGALNTAGSGPVGIWAWDSNNITIQYNESHHNHTSGTDGGGFDFDGGVTNSVMQYNYAHDNDGAGFLLAGYAGASPNSGNIIRYNISQDDGRKTVNGGIFIWDGAGNMTGNAVFNNTVYTSPSPSNASYSMVVSTPIRNSQILNNIFFSSGVGTGPLVVAGGQVGVSFEYNDYFASAGASPPAFGDAVHVGDMLTDPRLLGPGTGGTVGNPYNLASLTGYYLDANSPARDGGVNLAAYGLNAGGVDFFGHSVPQGTSYDIGAYELSQETTTVPPVPGSFGKAAPANGATGQAASLTLSWGAASGATTYEYCVDTTNDNACSGWTSTGGATSVGLSGLTQDTALYWHVRADNAGGTTYANGSGAAFWNFTTQATTTVPGPGSFGKAAPANGATGQATSLTLSWRAASGATTYEYCVDTTNDNACSGWTSTGGATSVRLSGLAVGTAYYWHARASNAGGTTYANGSGVAFWRFTTQKKSRR